jgi:cyclophilin family peptidyl-prolyl cis-trans isomerase
VRLYHGAAAGSLVASAILLAGCGQIIPNRFEPVPDDSTPGGDDAVDACEYVPTGEAAKPVNLPPTTGVPTSGSVRYVLQMTEGEVTITMDRAAAPCTVNSFISLARQGYFDKTRCHRLADSGIFILQCGDPTGTGRGGPGYEFANETAGAESYTRGVVAMANAGPGTNGSQFFLVWDDSTSLDQAPDYTIFGSLDPASRDVVAAMAAEGQDGSNPDGTGRPNNPSEIIRVAPA